MPMTRAEVARIEREWKKRSAQLKKNMDNLLAEDRYAKKNKTLVGRFIREQVADGYAYYRIVKENKTTVRIEHVKDIGGDDYMVRYFGSTATINKDYAAKSVEYRDALEKLFSEKRGK